LSNSTSHALSILLHIISPQQTAYQLTNHPIVVHWDMDVAVLQPLDDLYDVMIYPSSHPIHIAARERIERQHPEEMWPERIDAFITRDVTSAKPWEKVLAVQGGFLVARPDIGEEKNYKDNDDGLLSFSTHTSSSSRSHFLSST
jgi:hypothetical protein